MEGGEGALLLAAGLLGGVVNAIAGGATLFTFPAMLAAGLPPILANASNAVAVAPATLVAALADRRALPPATALVLAGLATMLLGSALGAWLLLVTPQALFARAVPLLIGSATLLFALGPWLQRHARGGRPGRARALALVPVAIYGGYFGAGVGVMLLALIGATGREDIRTANALKNLYATAASLVAVGVFTAMGMVAWPQTLAMLSGAALGGALGGTLVRVVPAKLVRWVVIGFGAVMTLAYALPATGPG